MRGFKNRVDCSSKILSFLSVFSPNNVSKQMSTMALFLVAVSYKLT